MSSVRRCHCETAPEYSDVIEDDGRVCYAYMMRGGAPVGDVWLYNSIEAPETPEWTLPDARDRMPFLNPPGFADAAPRFDLDDASIIWSKSHSGRLAAHIGIGDESLAVVAEGEAPGWHRFATQRGPLANPLSEYREGA